MKKSLSAAILILTLAISLFSCGKAAPEPATQISDGDSAKINEDFDTMESKLSEAETATAVNNTDSFAVLLESSDKNVISYEGSDDIAIASENIAEKTVTISTTGSVSLDSRTGTLIVNGAEKGFTANARAESIILAGNGITADIKSETGTILVQGKDITKLFYYTNPFKKAFGLFLMPIAMKKHRNIEPSMLQDLKHGKACEVDAINGVVCEWGRRCGIPTPVNDRIVEVIKKEQSGELKLEKANINLFADLL